MHPDMIVQVLEAIEHRASIRAKRQIDAPAEQHNLALLHDVRIIVRAADKAINAVNALANTLAEIHRP